jgi:hypothetical protein
VRPEGETIVREPPGYASQWSGVVADCLERVRRGEPPATTPEDASRAMSLAFEAYERAGVDQVPHTTAGRGPFGPFSP